MNRRATYDTIVVGARAAGAATAMLLARQGRRVLVVDRSRYGSDTLSTHALMRAGTLQLHRWGLLDDVVAAGTPPVRRTTFHYDDGDVDVSIKPAGGVDALYAPRRTVLDRILADAAERAGADVRFGTTVTDLVRARDGRVTGVAARDGQGHEFVAHAPLTVGADGMHSVVARLVDAPVRRLGSGASATVYGYWDGVDVDGYQWYFRQRSGAGAIPTNDGAVCVFSAVERGSVETGTAPRALFEGTLTRVAPELIDLLAGAPSSSGYRMFHGRPGWMRRPYGPGWALAGDAGYFKDPISAHGITDALRDAELLACAVGSADAGPVLDDALRGYGERRDELSVPLFRTTDTIARYRWDTAGIRRLLIELSSAMAAEVEALSALPESTRPVLVR
jgi:flavin-dependent dehydrogenase